MKKELDDKISRLEEIRNYLKNDEMPIVKLEKKESEKNDLQ